MLPLHCYATSQQARKQWRVCCKLDEPKSNMTSFNFSVEGGAFADNSGAELRQSSPLRPALPPSVTQATSPSQHPPRASSPNDHCCHAYHGARGAFFHPPPSLRQNHPHSAQIQLPNRAETRVKNFPQKVARQFDANVVEIWLPCGEFRSAVSISAPSVRRQDDATSIAFVAFGP